MIAGVFMRYYTEREHDAARFVHTNVLPRVASAAPNCPEDNAPLSSPEPTSQPHLCSHSRGPTAKISRVLDTTVYCGWVALNQGYSGE